MSESITSLQRDHIKSTVLQDVNKECVFVFSPAACCAVLWQEAGRRHESKNASVNVGQLSLLRQSLEQSERTDEHVRDQRTRKENNQTQQMNGPEERNMCAGCDDIRGSDIVSVQVYVTV